MQKHRQFYFVPAELLKNKSNSAKLKEESERGGGSGVIQVMHLGDCHFEDKFYIGMPGRRKLLDESREAALAAAVDIAVAKKVDLFVWTGDVFDGERRVGLKVRTMLEKTLSALRAAEIEIAWMTGNHDPADFYHAQGLDSMLSEFGVHIFNGAPREATLISRAGESYRLVGSGHERKGLAENRASLYPVNRGEIPVIGLLHGSVQGLVTGPDALYFPCTKADLARLGYDLICLGHLHIPGKIESPAFQAFYSGSLMGLSFKETGPRGAYLHTLSHGTVESQFLIVSPLEWQSLHLTVTPEMSLNDVLEKVGSFSAVKGDQTQLLSAAVKVHGKHDTEAEETPAPCTPKKIIMSLLFSGVNDTLLNALRHDPEELNERLCGAAGAEEIEVTSDLMPERLLELSRTGDSFLAHLNACLKDEAFLNRVMTRFAERALSPALIPERETAQDALDQAEGFLPGSGAEVDSLSHPADQSLLEVALRDLWPRWMGRLDR